MLRIFGTSYFSRERKHTSMLHVNTLLVLFDAYPLFQEHNCGIKQGLGVLWRSIKSND